MRTLIKVFKEIGMVFVVLVFALPWVAYNVWGLYRYYKKLVKDVDTHP